MPSLAGQPAQFIATQLFMFREGNRKDPQMTPMAAPLSNAEMNELARTSRRRNRCAGRPQTPRGQRRGRPGLAEKFNCTQCHGAALRGQQHIPRLAGQQPEYLRTQLRGFKARTRFDMDGNMTAAAQPLSDKDIEILVDYLAGLGPQ